MKLTRLSILVLAVALAVGAIGCATDTQTAQSPNEVQKNDGSTVAVSTAPDGTKTEVRTFKSGDVSRVTRTTQPGGKRTATVEFREGRKADLEDENDIEQAMDATSDWLVMAANKTWDTTKMIGKEVADKAEDVADKSADIGEKTVEKGKDVGKAVGKGTKRGAEEVADKAEDVGDKVGKGAKKVGKQAKKVGEKIKP